MIEDLGEAPDTAADTAARLRAAQAKWERLSSSDYDDIRTISQLIAKVAERYSLPLDQAKTDVETWAKEMQL